MMKWFDKKIAIFAAAGALILSWQMLLPGYVLTLDMVFGPQVPILPLQYALSTYPLWALLHVVRLVLSVWLIQKAIIFGLFFLLFYLPARFFPFEIAEENSLLGPVRFFVAIFFAINPFVYERFMAGQWLVLLAYACLPGLVYALEQYFSQPSWRNVLFIYGWLFISGIFALHFFVVGALVMAVFSVVNGMMLLWRKEGKLLVQQFYRLLIGGLGFLAINSYWFGAYLLGTSRLGFFANINQWEAFKTAGDGVLGVTGNVALLYGFWPESQSWIKTIFFAKDNYVWWLASFLPLGVLLISGIITGLKKKKYTRLTCITIILGLLSLIFSCGIGDGLFKPINMWLFQHVGFWSGFRDSQKWSSVLVLVYSMLAGLGLHAILGRIKSPEAKKFIFLLVCLTPINYTSQELFGFQGQLKPVWYPDSWQQVNEKLSLDRDCKAISLPWHMYYTPAWNGTTLTANPASAYFNCEILSSKNIELAGVQTGEGDNEYNAIESLITDNKADPDRVVRELAKRGYKYIIFSTDIVTIDPYKYPFLQSKDLDLIYSSQNIYLFRILQKNY